jgi:hypothetical protein
MTSLRALLQDADPLHHEASRLDADRERIRVTMLQETTTAQRWPVRGRLTVIAALVTAAVGIVALGYQLWTNASSPVLAAVRFEVRMAEDHPAPGLIVAPLAGSDRLIYLYPQPVVRNDDIAQASVVQEGPERFAVAVDFMQSGAERMRAATTAHVGRPVAILIDGDVVMAPVVRAPISESALISGKYTRAEAERIAEGVIRR